MEGVVSITQISERDAALLEGAGFVREGRRSEWRVPAGCTVVRAQLRSDLVDIKVFYGDAQLLSVFGKTAFYDYQMSASVKRKNLEAYVRGELSSDAGGSAVEAAHMEARAAEERAAARLKDLQERDPEAYELEGLIARLSAAVARSE